MGSLLRLISNPAGALAGLQIRRARRQISRQYIRGIGIEVGAGARPFPLYNGATCFYGDIRDEAQLQSYFGKPKVAISGRLDAQTMANIAPASVDFVISAHVIEHLWDPISAIRAALRCIRAGGVLVLIVPELTKTFDRDRPSTTIEHLELDALDGGEGTLLQAHREHARFVHPALTGERLTEAQINAGARKSMADGMDLHVHAWREADFFALLDHLSATEPFSIEARRSVGNENIYVLRAHSSSLPGSLSHFEHPSQGSERTVRRG